MAPTAIPKTTFDEHKTRAQLQGCLACGFEHYDPDVDVLNELDLCPVCAAESGYVEVRVCRSCGELYPADDECHCRGTRWVSWNSLYASMR